MNLKRALAQLASPGPKLPEEALRWALENWTIASGALTQVLARCSRELENGPDSDFTTAYFGLHLMAQKRETRAFRLLCSLSRSPDGLPAILGDAMAWSGAAIMISLFDGDASELRGIIERVDVDPMMAACGYDALAWLTAAGHVSRNETLDFLRGARERAIASDDPLMLWENWASSVALLGMDELMPHVPDALSRVAEPGTGVELAELEYLRALAREDEAGMLGFEREGIGPVDDAIATLRQVDAGLAASDDKSMTDEGLFGEEFEGPAVNEFRDVGRNDPCPCGSGKKYKKCCLAA